MELYIYIEHDGDELSLGDLEHIQAIRGDWKPVIWGQNGRYGWISMKQMSNLQRRYADLKKQQKGYAKDKPIDLAFHWGDTTPLDPAMVKLIRKTSPQE